MAAQSQMINTWSSILFLFGKTLRFILFFVFLYQVVFASKNLVGYTQSEIILFFLVFNFIDIFTQVLFRGVYQFRPLIVSGDYDLDLLKPIPSFFRPVFGWTDILDLITLIPFSAYFIWFALSNNFFSGFSVLLFLILLLNSVLIAFAFHLFVCAICVLTTEIDHLIWIYRDLTSMARFSTDIYPKAIQYLLTFTIPVVILMTVPAKGLMGLLSWPMVILSMVITVIFLLGSFLLWRYALSQYSSASS